MQKYKSNPLWWILNNTNFWSYLKSSPKSNHFIQIHGYQIYQKKKKMNSDAPQNTHSCWERLGSRANKLEPGIGDMKTQSLDLEDFGLGGLGLGPGLGNLELGHGLGDVALGPGDLKLQTWRREITTIYEELGWVTPAQPLRCSSQTLKKIINFRGLNGSKTHVLFYG